MTLRQRDSGQFLTQDPNYGEFGGQYVSQILIEPLRELTRAFNFEWAQESFRNDYLDLLEHYAGRPTPLSLCRNITSGTGTKIYLKREDLLHGGAHKTNQVLGQVLLAKKMGKKRIIAETGAGQHGVATAIGAAMFGLECNIYMGEIDIARQAANIDRMRLMGATVIPVTSGSRTLKDACNEALRDWSGSYATSHYVVGTAAGPHPYPMIVRELQRIIGREARSQFMSLHGELPDAVIACVGGGSNAMGIFTDFLDDPVRLVAVEPAGRGLDTTEHGASLTKGEPGIFFGMRSLLLSDPDGQIKESHSISAGLDFPSVGPQIAHLVRTKRVECHAATDADAVNAFTHLAKSEGIIPALESSHALAWAIEAAHAEPEKSQNFIVNLSGRGDKDMASVKSFLEGQS